MAFFRALLPIGNILLIVCLIWLVFAILGVQLWKGTFYNCTDGIHALSHTVPDLARRARMSDRTFARRFVAETGTTPLKWVTTQRVLHARTLLEQTKLGIEQIASEAGFGTAALLRHHFRRVVGVPPQDYRRTFQTTS